MKKPLLFFGGIILACAVIIGSLMLFWLGPAMETTIESVGSRMIGAPITIEKLRIYPVPGTLHLTGLVIGNPKGFSSDSALTLKKLDVDIAITSLFTDTIVIRKIVIKAPEFTYERTLKTDNISTIRDNIKTYGDRKGTATPSPDENPREQAGKKVVIDRLVIRNGRVKAKISALPSAVIPLPDMEKTGIGKNNGGLTWSGVAAEIFSFFDDAILNVVSNLGNTAEGVIQDVGNAATDAVKHLGDLFRKEE